jgi:putative ABC transport system substrate-binding protein
MLDVRRREFITLLGGAVTTWPLAARAEQGERVRRIGVLMGYAETDTAAQAQVVALRHELQKLGWEEGRNIRIDVRFPGSDAGRVRTMLMELMNLTPDVLVSNTNLVTAVVQAEVRTIPVIFLTVADPVGSGFVSNETRPNANLTGFANWESSMSGKWLELFKEVVPQVDRVGYMMHPETPASVDFFKFAEARAPALKIKLVGLGVHDAGEIERTLTAFAAEGNGGPAKSRVETALGFVKSLTRAQVDGAEDKVIAWSAGGNDRKMKGKDYLQQFALPNFFFFVTTAYNILRHRGVPLGKRDFLGPVNWL